MIHLYRCTAIIFAAATTNLLLPILLPSRPTISSIPIYLYHCTSITHARVSWGHG